MALRIRASRGRASPCHAALATRVWKKIGIVSEPETISFALTASDKCLIIASDGVWDFIPEEEAVNMVKTFAPDADAACKALVETASQRWIEDDPTYRDDISAIVVFTPLDGAAVKTVSHETVSFTSDSVIAVQREKKEEDAAAKGVTTAPPPTSMAPAAAVPAAAPEGKKEEAKPELPVTTAGNSVQPKMSDNKKVQASKAQRRRSVVTKFG